MDEDENISLLLAMGFQDVDEIRRALRIGKGDVNEAVGILTDSSSSTSSVMGPPMPSSSTSTSAINELASLDIDMKADGGGGDGDNACFPVSAFYELESRVFQDNWSIPYKKEEAFGRCLRAATKLAEENLMAEDEYCAKFHDRILPEAFKKLLSSHATQRWQGEIQEGIFDMLELFLDLVVARLKAPSPPHPVPVLMLQVLATAFDTKVEWNFKNRHKETRGRWTNLGADRAPHAGVVFAEGGRVGVEQFGWLCDLINQFGENGGFDLITAGMDRPEATVRDMAALITPVANCADLLRRDGLDASLSACMTKAFKCVEGLEDKDLKSKEISALSDLLAALKTLCLHFWLDRVEDCDRLRLSMIFRMLKAPHFSSKMNALREVSRLIDESKQSSASAGSVIKSNQNIGVDRVVEWMAENRVLSVALEGNIDQVQYTDRIKAIVEFLGSRLSNDDLTKMWRLQLSSNAHVRENIHDIIASAAAQFTLSQFEHLTALIKDTWQGSSDRIREKLLELIGKLGREATQMKSTQAILQLLWEVSHLSDLPKQLMERALNEQLEILTSLTYNRDSLKRVYVMKCVEDIKHASKCALSSVKHLRDICRSYSRNTALAFQKPDKATLGELNREHEIVKLLSKSLKKCHELAAKVALGGGSGGDDNKPALLPTTAFDSGRYTHSESLDLHLDLLKFLLKEGELYLSWSRCEELWSVLVCNDDAIQLDRDKAFEWFQVCICDLEEPTQHKLFTKRYLELSPHLVTPVIFESFKTYFESINVQSEAMRKPSNIVEKLDLVGINYIWRLISESQCDEITNLAIEYLLNISFANVSPRLKAEPVKLHQSFFNKCYTSLASILRAAVKEGAADGALNDTFDLETSLDLDSESRTENFLDDINLVEVLKMPPSARNQRLQQVSRILYLAERYISQVEQSFGEDRTMPAHFSTFRGASVAVRVISKDASADPPRIWQSGTEVLAAEMTSFENETVGALRQQVSAALKTSPDQLVLSQNGVELGADADSKSVMSLAKNHGLTLTAKTKPPSSSATSSSTSTAIVLYDNKPKSLLRSSPTPCSSSAMRGPTYAEEKERTLPGVIMASGGQVFRMLYQLAGLNDPAVFSAVRSLVHLIPTDPSVTEVFDSVSYHSVDCGGSSVVGRSPAVAAAASADASPKPSPRKSVGSLPPFSSTTANLEEAKAQLISLFDASTEHMNPFRVLYNLEVLSGRLVPPGGGDAAAQQFCLDFLNCGGLQIVLGVLERNALPTDIDYGIRQLVYLMALQLADFLLGGEDSDIARDGEPKVSNSSLSSPVIKPTPPKRSALDSSAVGATTRTLPTPSVQCAAKVLQTMKEADFCAILSCLMRVAWAAAGGNLSLASTSILKAHGSDSRLYAVRRSRDNSTGSSGSESGEGPSAAASAVAPASGAAIGSPLSGSGHQPAAVTSGDAIIACKAIELMVACLEIRTNVLASFYTLPLIGEFVVDVVLGSSSAVVRRRACAQLIRMSRIRPPPVRSLDLNATGGDGDTGGGTAAVQLKPAQFLTRIILKTPVPLWMPSCQARGISHAILGQCSEYFDLRCALLGGLSRGELQVYSENAADMVDDEVNLLHNFSTCDKEEDCVLLAGHLKLVQALLSCEGVDKVKAGAALIPELLHVYLFPASNLVKSSVKLTAAECNGVNPKCSTVESQIAAYRLLLELVRHCPANFSAVTKSLVSMHHGFSQELVSEFEYEPAVDRRGAGDFVGLKNAGATCYMNSVLQQLFCTPSICEQILAVDSQAEQLDADDSVFYQLQNVFAHLMESKLQYYKPEKFWTCFRLFGQPVNVREQQDAFEFYTQVVDQVDESLAKRKKPKIFGRRFEGVFSDQKICQGCPHRYEREEGFNALNLTVKASNLQESLDQFVKGELLDGDNAYFCEKCGAKRNTIKRLCVRKLPQTLVIQLKRFNYDWETNRAVKFDDFFEFPWSIDMAPYTAEGIRDREEEQQVQPDVDADAAASGLGGGGGGGIGSSSQYELVGVVVHSGQASAGHYYSYIKDRRPPNVSRENRGKWFKFNDTSVEYVDMTDAVLATECFGGSFKVSKPSASASSLPESRQRYWNAYMLVYESVKGFSAPHATGSRTTTPRKATSVSRPANPSAASMTATKTLSAARRVSEPHQSLAARDSLSELTNLLEKGERKGLFGGLSRMPAAIERGVQEENLRFLENREVYCEEYYDFVQDLLKAVVLTGSRRSSAVSASDFDEMCVEAVRLGVHFLLNTYLHLKTRRAVVVSQVTDAMAAILERSGAANDYLIHYLASGDEGLQFIRPFLVESPAKDVRQSFADLLHKTVRCYERHNGDTESDDVNRLLATLVSKLEKDLPANVKLSAQFFWVLAEFAQMGARQCRQLIDLDAFRQLVKFLLGVDPTETEGNSDGGAEAPSRRRWTSLQLRELGDLHRALAYMILACDTGSLKDDGDSGGLAMMPPPAEPSSLLPLPTSVRCTLSDSVLAPLFVREMTVALREAVPAGRETPIVDMLVYAARDCSGFTSVLLEEIVKQYNSVNSGELRNLSILLMELLILEDGRQRDRVRYIIEGDPAAKVDGLLALIRSSQSSDSCRAYQCIKMLVHASQKSALVKEYLLEEDPRRWQWAVNWLRSKMTGYGYWSPSAGGGESGGGGGGGSGGSGGIGADLSRSNEDSTTRTFQRTTSAQVTLDEADAILAEFSSTAEEINQREEDSEAADMDTTGGSCQEDAEMTGEET